MMQKVSGSDRHGCLSHKSQATFSECYTPVTHSVYFLIFTGIQKIRFIYIPTYYFSSLSSIQFLKSVDVSYS